MAEWRQEELERINAELTGAERKAALCQLLDQETQLIASIGRHKNDANDENHAKAIQQFLEKVKFKYTVIAVSTVLSFAPTHTSSQQSASIGCLNVFRLRLQRSGRDATVSSQRWTRHIQSALRNSRTSTTA